MAEAALLNIDEGSSSEEEDELIVPQTDLQLARAAAVEGASQAIPRKAEPKQFISPEFLAASNTIASDPWNVEAWMRLLQIAEAGLAGDMTLPQAYEKFLARFPGAAHYWLRLAQYYFQLGDLAALDDVLTRCLVGCADVELWLLYLKKVQNTVLSYQGVIVTPQHDMYLKAQHQIGEAFEFALAHVGMAIDADQLFRAYLEFIYTWPEASEADIGKKTGALRKVFQRAVQVPTNGVEALWSDYEVFEHRTGEHFAARVLPDFQPKFQAAKAAYRERKRLYSALNLKRLAVPANNNSEELEQLQAWKRLLQTELRNPEDLSPEDHRARMRHAFQLSVRCMRFHPELWVQYAQYEIESGDVHAAKVVLKNAMDAMPDCGIIRQVFAELEERLDNLPGARTLLMSFFEAYPSALSFTLAQRFIRRTEGKAAARRFFSSTLPLRNSAKLGHQVYTSHALLELLVNREPHVALRVFELARANRPECIVDPAYIEAYAQALIHEGKLDDLRALYDRAIERAPPSVGVRLLDELIEHESTLLMASPQRFEQLLRRRRDIQGETDRRGGRDFGSTEADLFEGTRIRTHCWQRLHIRPHGSVDGELVGRITMGDGEVSKDAKQATTGAGAPASEKAGSDVPSFLKDLLHKLPAYTGPAPDIDSLLRQLRATPLPPRAVAPMPVVTPAPLMFKGNKRKSEEMTGKDSDDEDFGPEDGRADIFRQRQRSRLTRQVVGS